MSKIKYYETKIKKLIKNRAYCKVFIANDEVMFRHFDGIILSQNKEFLLMCEFFDFHYDGFVVFKKSDISEIKRGKNAKFFDKILDKENIKVEMYEKYLGFEFELSDYKTMFERLSELNLPIIVEQLYYKNEKFQLGLINKIKKDRVYIDYLNASGEFDLKPVCSEFKDITFFTFDSPYANFYYKYSINI